MIDSFSSNMHLKRISHFFCVALLYNLFDSYHWETDNVYSLIRSSLAEMVRKTSWQESESKGYKYWFISIDVFPIKKLQISFKRIFISLDMFTYQLLLASNNNQLGHLKRIECTLFINFMHNLGEIWTTSSYMTWHKRKLHITLHSQQQKKIPSPDQFLLETNRMRLLWCFVCA